MTKKIIILTETLSANGVLQNNLLNMGYEIMVSKELLVNPKDKELVFLQNFDLIIYQQSIYSGLKENLLDNLLLLGKPIIVLTFEAEQLNKMKSASNDKLHFVSYPISISELAGKLAQVFEETKDYALSKEETALNWSSNLSLSGLGSQTSDRLPRKNHSFSLKDRTLIIDEWLVPLTKKEYQVLKYFIESDQRVFSSQTLCEAIWSNAQQKNKQALLSNLINRIKQKIVEKTSIFEPFILNKKGVGYYLNAEFMMIDDTVNEYTQVSY